MKRVIGAISAAGLVLVSASVAASRTKRAGRPTSIGSCAFTTVREVTQRLEDGRTHQAVANSGSTVMLANGVYGVSYDQVSALNRSRVGDWAMTCLVRFPRHCPSGDKRGIIYTTTNLRTEESWTLPDSEHQCGGA